MADRAPDPPADTEADGRYLVVNGRRWRASDPGIPEPLRRELVAELMAARRAVRTAAESARPRVQDAKVALGERGEKWWEPASAAGLQVRLAATARTLLRHRAADGAVSADDLARVVGGDEWADLRPQARSALAALAGESVLRIDADGAEARRGPGWES